MLKQISLFIVFLCLAYAKETDLLEFTSIADTHFSMQLKKDKKDDFSTHFVMHEHDDQEVKKNKSRNITIDRLFLTLNPHQTVMV